MEIIPAFYTRIKRNRFAWISWNGNPPVEWMGMARMESSWEVGSPGFPIRIKSFHFLLREHLARWQSKVCQPHGTQITNRSSDGPSVWLFRPSFCLFLPFFSYGGCVSPQYPFRCKIGVPPQIPGKFSIRRIKSLSKPGLFSRKTFTGILH